MTSRERRKRRRARRRAQILAALLIILAAIVALRVTYKPPEETDALTKAETPERVNLVQAIAETKTPEREETEAEPEAVSRYAGLELSDHDIEILAALVYHEARGECFEGQVAVIEVVLNRCLSEYFPDTVEEVVFQKYGDVWQFSPAPYLWTAEPDEAQYDAVNTAINSPENILPLETVYFSGAPYNDNIVAIIGNHYFCSIWEVTENE